MTKQTIEDKFWEWFESEKEEAYKRGREDEAIECQKDMERVVEETLRGYVANEQLIESRRNDCSKGTIMWSKFVAEILNKYWFNKALSSDGEKKGKR